MSELKGCGICKECTNGTLDNEKLVRFLYDEIIGVYCAACGGSHIDGELYIQSDVHPGDAADAEVEEEEVEDEISDPFSDEPFEREVGA